MTRDDVDRLWGLLAIFRGNDPHLGDKKLKAAWHLVLEPYDPADVKAAVAAYFREKRYWPDVTDIAALCQKPVKSQDAVKAPFDRAAWALYAPQIREWDNLVERRKRAGLPGTILEAARAGISREDWMDMLKEAGLLCA